MNPTPAERLAVAEAYAKAARALYLTRQEEVNTARRAAEFAARENRFDAPECVYLWERYREAVALAQAAKVVSGRADRTVAKAAVAALLATEVSK